MGSDLVGQAPPTVAEVKASAIVFTTEILFVVEKSAVNRIFCFHGILGNLGNFVTSCHVLSRKNRDCPRRVYSAVIGTVPIFICGALP